MKQFTHSMFAHVKRGFSEHQKVILLSSSVATCVTLILAGGYFAYITNYQEQIYPGITAGGLDLAGLTQSEATLTLQQAFEAMLGDGVALSAEDQTGELELRAGSPDDPDFAYNLIDFSADQLAFHAYQLGRDGNDWQNFFTSLGLLLRGRRLTPDFIFLDTQLATQIEQTFAELEEPAEPTRYEIDFDDEIVVEVIEGEIGRRLDVATALATLKNDALDFNLEPLTIAVVDTEDVIAVDQALELENEVVAALEAAPYTLTFTSELGFDYEWDIADDDLAEWLIPVEVEDELALGLDVDAMADFLEEIHSDVDVEPINARFQMSGGRVTEFAGSMDGVELAESETIDALTAELGTDELELAIAVAITKPDITTDNVNDLGIKEILGVGVSDFSGSPSNRIANIKHGVSKLNGLIVAPGDTLSLLEHLRPFTVADGYLPELVIVGDEIKPEVGGGLCQIGTTTFRATMNAGLEVVNRRNHSLVVSYYDDPSNGNPGTDATIYDPAPDYVLRNDTENYILLQTEVDMSTMQLIFTFWGTSDGRQGYYTPPIVLGWTGYGATQYKETTSLAPGQMSCQSPHSGATTSFDYYVEYADGTIFEKNYTSIYRSLPRVCLVGVSEVGAGETDGEGNYLTPADDSEPDETETSTPETSSE